MAKISKVKIIYTFTLLGIVFWIAAIFLAPYLKSLASPINKIIYYSFSKICHQAESRCFYIFGNQMAVCSRCLGIYIGFLAGTFYYPAIRGFNNLSLPKHKTFLLATVPIGIDTIGNFFFLWNTAGWLRLTLGFIWGIVLPLYFITGIADFILNLNFHNKKQ